MEFAVLTYGMLASFIVASVSRNNREQRRHPPILMLFGWLMLSFSAASAALLIGYAGLNESGLLVA